MNFVDYRNRVAVDDIFADDGGEPTWTKVIVSESRSQISASERLHTLRTWCHDNTTQKWSSYIRVFFFESEKDALLFALRWL